MKKRWKGSRAQEAGILMAAADVPLSFQKTLMPRKDTDQGLITGLSLATNYGIAVLVQEQIESIASAVVGGGEDDERRWRHVALLLDLAAIGGGIALQRAFSQVPDERLPRAGARTAGYWLAKSAAAGAMVDVLQGLLSGDRDGSRASLKVVIPAAGALAGLREYQMRGRRATDTHVTAEWSVSGRRSGLIGTGVGVGLLALSTAERAAAGGVAGALSKVLPGSKRAWRPLGHLATLGAFAFGVKQIVVRFYRKVEAAAEQIEPAFEQRPTDPLVSGSPESLIAWDTLSKQGRRNVSTALTPAWIDHVMGEEGAIQPIRVYVGLESAADDEARVALAMAELERAGAFDRELLMIISPTGTGYVNYVAVEAAEYMTRGNMASVAMQYSLRPSPLSVDRVDEGRHLQRRLVRAISERVAGMKRRPEVVLFGESLGAWTSQDHFQGQGTQGLLDRGIDRALWIGTPFASKWKTQVLTEMRPDTDRSLVGVFNDFGQVEAMRPQQREKLRFVMITHDNDAVGHFWLDMMIQAPPWLDRNHENRPATVPKNEKWSPPTTFYQTAIDMANAAQVVPGQFEATGHDYRADLAPFIREVYGLKATDEQLDRIVAAMIEFELKRAARIKELDPQKKPLGKRKAAPADKDLAAKKSAAKKATAKKPAAKKPAAKKSPAKKATTKKPAAKKPAARPRPPEDGD